MKEKHNLIIPLVAIVISLGALLFTFYQSVYFKRITLKNDLSNSYIKYDKAKTKLACYYDQAKNKSIFSEEIILDHSKAIEKIKILSKDLKEALKLVDEQWFFSNSENKKLIWSYEAHASYGQNLRDIKSSLTDADLKLAVRNCDDNEL